MKPAILGKFCTNFDGSGFYANLLKMTRFVLILPKAASFETLPSLESESDKTVCAISDAFGGHR